MSPPSAVSPTLRMAEPGVASSKVNGSAPSKLAVASGFETQSLDAMFEGDWDAFKFDYIRESTVNRAMTRRYFKVHTLINTRTSCL